MNMALTHHRECLQEKTELEEQRRALQEEVVRYRAKIRQLENDLLFRLSNSQVCLQQLNSWAKLVCNRLALACVSPHMLSPAG